MSKPYALPASNYNILAHAYTEAKIKHRLTEREHVVLMVLERRAWGWGIATVALDVAQVAAELGLWPKQVEETIAKLLDYAVLYRDGEEIGIQTDVSRWTAPLRKSRDRKRSFEKSEETANDRLISANDHLQNRKRSFDDTILKAANSADYAEPKETTKESKETFPLKGVSQEGGQATARKVSGLVAMAQETEWFEGEQARFLKLTPYSRIRDLGIPSGKTADLIKVYLSASKETRQALWAYVDHRMSTADIKKPDTFNLDWVVKYLQDPASYPAISRKDSFLAAVDLKTAEPAASNPWKDRPYWRLYDPRFVDVVRDGEDDQARYLINTVGTRHGLDTFQGLNGVYRAKGLDAVMRHVDYLWDKRPATKEAANG